MVDFPRLPNVDDNTRALDLWGRKSLEKSRIGKHAATARVRLVWAQVMVSRNHSQGETGVGTGDGASRPRGSSD